jgi:hypothetical protein
LNTPAGFLHYFLGLGFEGDMFAKSLWQRVTIFPTLLRFQFNIILLSGSVIGALFTLWQDRKLALLLIGSFTIHTIIVLTYRAPQTVEYEMPAYVMLTLLTAMPVKAISKPGTNQLIQRHAAKAVFFVLCVTIILASGANLLTHLPNYVMLSQSHDTRDCAETLLRNAPPDAIVLANWHWFTPLRYLQTVEGLRTDVTVDYVFPHGRSLAQNWVDEIRAHIHERPVIVVHYYEQEYKQLPYRFEPFGQAFLVRAEPRHTLPGGLKPLDTVLDTKINLLGYRLSSDETEPSRPLILTLAWSPIVTQTGDVSIFAQLIGHDGRLWSATRDTNHTASHLSPGEIIIERFAIYPLLHAGPGDYALVVGAYTSNGRMTNQDGADATRLTTIHLKPATLRPVTNHVNFIRFTGGATLIGVDYDTSLVGQVRTYTHWAGPGKESELYLLDSSGVTIGQRHIPALTRGQYATIAFDGTVTPSKIHVSDGERPRQHMFLSCPIQLPQPERGERYVPLGDSAVLVRASRPHGTLAQGSKVEIDFYFAATRPLERDYIVSTALNGFEDNGTLAWQVNDDSVPALGAIPSLKWIRGSRIYDPHHLTIPGAWSTLESYVVVYDHFTQVPLLPLDERLQLGHRIPLTIWP